MSGINSTLYNKKDTMTEPINLLSQQDIMNRLQIKDVRTFINFIDKEKFPYFKIGRKIYSTVEQYNKWINSKMNNRY